MAVEVAREDAVELAVLERQIEGVALDEGRVQCLLARDREHRLALIEADDFAAEVAREEARAARDVEGARRAGETATTRSSSLPLLVPARAVAFGEAAAAEPPVVVLAGPGVVVGLHDLVGYVRASARVRPELLGGA